MHKILVVEDLEPLRTHMRAVLQKTLGEVEIIEAVNGTQGLAEFERVKPDMLILDIVMPEMTGTKLAKLIWSKHPNTKILFWSQFHQESYVREIGKMVPDEAIHGYALKTESEEKLAHAIKSVLILDNPYIDPLVRNIQHSVKHKDSLITPDEYSILVSLILGLTDKAIADREHISVRGVQNRISSLSQKLVKNLDSHSKESAGMEVLNTRARIILEAFRQRYIDVDDIAELEAEMIGWMSRRYNFDWPES